ncbi:MAG: hypothetical protein KatS3mg068_1544 [Candidatus Sericytochromatia bacterium]|nr:MAG: hypothetical protein KatS3mg068_1544 [Candidatus Sericytochromatia bacterium]
MENTTKNKFNKIAFDKEKLLNLDKIEMEKVYNEVINIVSEDIVEKLVKVENLLDFVIKNFYILSNFSLNFSEYTGSTKTLLLREVYFQDNENRDLYLERYNECFNSVKSDYDFVNLLSDLQSLFNGFINGFVEKGDIYFLILAFTSLLNSVITGLHKIINNKLTELSQEYNLSSLGKILSIIDFDLGITTKFLSRVNQYGFPLLQLEVSSNNDYYEYLRLSKEIEFVVVVNYPYLKDDFVVVENNLRGTDRLLNDIIKYNTSQKEIENENDLPDIIRVSTDSIEKSLFVSIKGFNYVNIENKNQFIALFQDVLSKKEKLIEIKLLL